MRRLSRIWFAVVFSLSIFIGSIAGALELKPSFGAGQSSVVGTLTTSYDYTGDPSGFPTMFARFEYADSKAVPEGWQLRWFQVVTQYDTINPVYQAAGVKPATWKNKDVTVYGMPFTDPPRGGYDYQQPAGDDSEPFYWHTQTEWPQAHKEGSYTLIVDTPKRYAPGMTAFETCLVLYRPLEEPKTIYLLEDGSFTWELRVVKQGSFLAIGVRSPRPVSNANTPAHAAYLEEALANAGFANWSVEPVPPRDFAGSPEAVPKDPSPVTGAVGGAGFAMPGASRFQDLRSSLSARASQMPSFSIGQQGLRR